MMKTILSFEKLIQFSVNLMSHIMEIVFVPLSVISKDLVDCLASLYACNSYALIHHSSQWARGNGGEEGDKTKANTKGESKIVPKGASCDTDSSVLSSEIQSVTGLTSLQETMMSLLPLAHQHVAGQILWSPQGGVEHVPITFD